MTDFVCAIDERYQHVCEGLPLYGEHEGKRYCLLHIPSRQKEPVFREAIAKKLRDHDFDFGGVYFPEGFCCENFEFETEVDFEHANFNKGVTFRGSTFKARANFLYCDFHNEADFSNTTFEKQANFAEMLSRDKAAFSGAIFCSTARFFMTEFRRKATFDAAEFRSDASFESTIFRGKVNFRKATFSGVPRFYKTQFRTTSTNFVRTVFNKATTFEKAAFPLRANFNGASFAAPISFVGTEFGLSTTFINANFADQVTFQTTTFNTEGGLVKFDNARIASPERVSFHTVTLRASWFINLNHVRQFDFTNVAWWGVDSGPPGGLDDEIENLQKWNIGSAHSLLAKVCRELAINAEDNREYPLANEFHYWSMDATRKRDWVFFSNKTWRDLLYRERWPSIARHFGLITTLYWALSGYGVRAARAFWMLVAIWFAFTILYVLADPSEFKEFGQGIGYRWQSAVYSLLALARLNPEPRPEEPGIFQFLVGLEGILGPLQIGLLLLAIRRKVMR